MSDGERKELPMGSRRKPRSYTEEERKAQKKRMRALIKRQVDLQTAIIFMKNKKKQESGGEGA